MSNVGAVLVNSELTIESGLSNNGTIDVGSSSLIVNDAVTLTGTGSIQFSGGFSESIVSSDFLNGDNGVADVLTIADGASQIISGDGGISSDVTIINNGGLSIGAGPVGLATRLENNSLFIIQDGGELEVLSSGRIVGGTLETQGSGCLLYTSPSPRDRTRSRMPSSA